MEQNIFQVANEDHLNHIINKNIKSLIVIMVGSKTEKNKELKKMFVNMATKYKNVFFVYIDTTNFYVTENRYFESHHSLPKFLFYFGPKEIGFVRDENENDFIKMLTIINDKVEEKRKLFQSSQPIPQTNSNQYNINTTKGDKVEETGQDSKPVPKNTQPIIDNKKLIELVNKKIEILNELREFNLKGVKTSKYDLNSDYDEMLAELMMIKQTFSVHSSDDQALVSSIPEDKGKQQDTKTELNVTDEEKKLLLKKQEQVKQIQELEMLQQKLQIQSFQKLQQLINIRQMKLEEERQSNNKEISS